ncbi:hypothetical protein V0288_20105 [Pannus brasiliensis CCIBt3594]|uniref:PEP-CTERM sorting domain-containing protein n=1 Tax=Pannus brasiliensis CCIBt3594 TaxID=1427578 RepID=A0AAW9QYU6_9CHRO
MKGKTANLLFGTGLLFLALGSIGIERASAAELTSFQNALATPYSPKGWNFYWNKGGAIGSSANYTSFRGFVAPDFYYTTDLTFPGSGDGAYAFFGNLKSYPNAIDNTGPGGHPGRGSSQASDGIERFVIAAYTVESAGVYGIQNLLLTNVDYTFPSTDGVTLRIYVNNRLKLSGGTTAGYNQSLKLTFFDLGNLLANDTIYVAIGSGATDRGDSFSLRYGIDFQSSVTGLAPLSTKLGSFSAFSESPLEPAADTPEPSMLLGLLSLFSIGLVRSKNSSAR